MCLLPQHWWSVGAAGVWNDLKLLPRLAGTVHTDLDLHMVLHVVLSASCEQNLLAASRAHV